MAVAEAHATVSVREGSLLLGTTDSPRLCGNSGGRLLDGQVYHDIHAPLDAITDGQDTIGRFRTRLSHALPWSSSIILNSSWSRAMPDSYIGEGNQSDDCSGAVKRE